MSGRSEGSADGEKAVLSPTNESPARRARRTMVAHGACTFKSTSSRVSLEVGERAPRRARRPDHPSYPDSLVVGPAAGLNCTQLLDVGSWQNATSPEEMAAIANPPSGRRSASGGGRGKERVPRHTDPARQQDRRQRGGLGKALAVSSTLTSLLRELQMVKRERDATLRDKDAEIVCLRRLAYGVEVMDVEAGVTHTVEDAGAGRSKRPARA